jgi:PLD-like domain
MTLIDNKNQTLQDALKNALSTAERVDMNEVFDLYIQKINDGSLEIRKTVSDYHGKFYIVHNRKYASQNGDFPGAVFMGSSNLTFRGLIGQGELNDSTREKSEFEEYQAQFEQMWSESKSISIADVSTKDEFLETIRPRIWRYNTPSPYHVCIRVLHELFDQEEINKLKTPQAITSGLYTDLEYQIDAIKMVMEKLNKYNGAILADVVGLGKSIIASAVARNIKVARVVKTEKLAEIRATFLLFICRYSLDEVHQTIPANPFNYRSFWRNLRASLRCVKLCRVGGIANKPAVRQLPHA